MTPHSYNTLNGVLLTINNLLKPYHEILILEIGVDCKKGMDKFTKYFDFDYCLVSAIGNQHIKTFKSIENIIKTKFELCDAGELFIETDTGNVKGSLLSEKIFIVSSDTGRIDVPKSTSGGRCEIETDTGDIKITLE